MVEGRRAVGAVQSAGDGVCEDCNLAAVFRMRPFLVTATRAGSGCLRFRVADIYVQRRKRDGGGHARNRKGLGET